MISKIKLFEFFLKKEWEKKGVTIHFADWVDTLGKDELMQLANRALDEQEDFYYDIIEKNCHK